MNIAIPFAAAVGAVVPSAGFNNNFTEVANKFNTYAVQTDVAKVISVAHTFSVAQLMAGVTFTGDVLFTDALYDIGKTGATRPRDGFFSRNVVVGGTLTAATLAGGFPAASLTGTALPAAIVTSSLQTLGVQNGDLLFADALYDIGKTGATRPRDGFFSRNLVVGGTLNATGAVTFSNGVTVSTGGVVLTTGTVSIGGNAVLGPRAAGWATQTGAQTRADMGGAPTLATVASTLDALIMDLRAHGMI